MNMITNTKHTPHGPDIEQLLDEAGITHIVVDRCPLPACEACHPEAGRLSLTQAAA